MPSVNNAAILERPDTIAFTPFKEEVLGDDDCLIEVKRVGICGSDVHYWKHGRIGDFVLEDPMILGHETSGIIKKVGKNVKNKNPALEPGMRVALEPGIPCGDIKTCDICRSSQEVGGDCYADPSGDQNLYKYNLCPNVRFFATPPIHGSLRNTLVHPAKYCFPLPDTVSLEEGAMCEPLSVGVYACTKGQISDGDTVLVFGAGPIGTICTLVALGMGAKKVIVSDIDEKRLDFLKNTICSATSEKVEILPTKMGEIPADVSKRAKEIAGGQFDCSIDCCGVDSAISAAILSTKNGRKVILVGMGRPMASIPLLDASCREVDLLGVFRYRFTYQKCIDMLGQKKIDVTKLITHYFDFTEDGVLDAMEHCRTGKNGCVKAMIRVGA